MDPRLTVERSGSGAETIRSSSHPHLSHQQHESLARRCMECRRTGCMECRRTGCIPFTHTARPLQRHACKLRAGISSRTWNTVTDRALLARAQRAQHAQHAQQLVQARVQSTLALLADRALELHTAARHPRKLALRDRVRSGGGGAPPSLSCCGDRYRRTLLRTCRGSRALFTPGAGVVTDPAWPCPRNSD